MFEADPSRRWLLDVEHLVFSGGGMRGIAYLGVMFAIERLFQHAGKNVYSQLKGVSGSSAGALFGMLLCLGCRGQILWKEVTEAGFEHVIQDSDISNLIDNWGFNNKRRIVTHLKALLKRYGGSELLTFQQLKDQCGWEFVVTMSNVDKGEIVYHSASATPDQPVWQSVAASMSIPLIFSPEKIDGQYYCDGGFLDNLPIVFPIETTAAFQLSRPSRESIPSFRVYLHKILYLTLSALEKIRQDQVPSQYKDHIIHVVTPEGVNSWDFAIPNQTKHNIAASGARSMLMWWNSRLVESHVASFILHAIALSVTDDA